MIWKWINFFVCEDMASLVGELCGTTAARSMSGTSHPVGRVLVVALPRYQTRSRAPVGDFGFGAVPALAVVEFHERIGESRHRPAAENSVYD